MKTFLKRAGGALAVLAAVLVLNFFLFRIMPGDPLTAIVDPRFSPEAKAALASQWGLDRPISEQFLVYVREMLSFRFGLSMMTGAPVWDELKNRVPNTVALLLPSLVFSTLLGLWLGIKAALRRGSLVERIVLLGGAVSFSFPSFFVQLLLLMCFSYAFPLFPLRGTSSVPPPEGFAAALDYVWHLALPVFSLTILGFGGFALYIRNMMVKALGEDYVTMARARGLAPRRVVWNHAFRSILPPVLTIVLMSLPGIVGGAVITETVFSMNGVGRFLLEATNSHDYPAASAAFFLLALLTVICNLIADICYVIVDPRVRREAAHE
ncbi:MAG: ABC transporter permease [Synergistaceae bacterium]|jgi:peptide/nickel transport system permease protein|nr:ABC transporter permease [Synergistaceae bacterium]